MTDQDNNLSHDPEEPTGLVPARDRWARGDGTKPIDLEKEKQQELTKRIQSAAVLITVALVALAIGGFLFGLMAVLFGVVMVFEWDRLTGDPHNPRPMTFTLLVLIAAEITRWQVGLPYGLAVAGVGTILALGLGFRIRKRDPLWDKITVGFGVLYIALPIMLLLEMREAANGLALVALTFVVTWGMDSGAYAAGRLIGGPKMAPKLSPGKTWAGLIGGMIVAGLAAVALVQIPETAIAGFSALPAQLLPGASLWTLGLVMALIGALTQGGDVFESWLKRRRGVKDSGDIIPGHGGVLDRMDGLVVAIPCISLLAFL